MCQALPRPLDRFLLSLRLFWTIRPKKTQGKQKDNVINKKNNDAVG